MIRLGYIRQLVVVDETGKILYQEETKTNIIDSLKDMPDNITGESYVIPFLILILIQEKIIP